jgi:hypothetical protein
MKKAIENPEILNELSDSEIIEYFHYNWDMISRFKYLPQDFIDRNANSLDWALISRYQTLSESMIRKYIDKIHWNNISSYQTLSESFIEEFKDNLEFYYIAITQNLSESFVRKHKDIVADKVFEKRKFIEIWIKHNRYLKKKPFEYRLKFMREFGHIEQNKNEIKDLSEENELLEYI